MQPVTTYGVTTIVPLCDDKLNQVASLGVTRRMQSSEVELTVHHNGPAVPQFTLRIVQVGFDNFSQLQSAGGKISIRAEQLITMLSIQGSWIMVTYQTDWIGRQELIAGLNQCLGLTPEGNGWLTHEGFRRTGEYLTVTTKPRFGNVVLREQHPFVLEIQVVPNEGVMLSEFGGLILVLYEEGGRPIRAAPLEEGGVALFHDLRISPMRYQARATPCPVADPPTQSR